MNDPAVWWFYPPEVTALLIACSVAGGLAIGIVTFWVLRGLFHWFFG